MQRVLHLGTSGKRKGFIPLSIPARLLDMVKGHVDQLGDFWLSWPKLLDHHFGLPEPAEILTILSSSVLMCLNPCALVFLLVVAGSDG